MRPEKQVVFDPTTASVGGGTSATTAAASADGAGHVGAAGDAGSAGNDEQWVEAALTGQRDHIYHAAMLDPHIATELDLDQIYALVDDLIEAHGEWLPAYQ